MGNLVREAIRSIHFFKASREKHFVYARLQPRSSSSRSSNYCDTDDRPGNMRGRHVGCLQHLCLSCRLALPAAPIWRWPTVFQGTPQVGAAFPVTVTATNNGGQQEDNTGTNLLIMTYTEPPQPVPAALPEGCDGQPGYIQCALCGTGGRCQCWL